METPYVVGQSKQEPNDRTRTLVSDHGDLMKQMSHMAELISHLSQKLEPILLPGDPKTYPDPGIDAPPLVSGLGVEHFQQMEQLRHFTRRLQEMLERIDLP